MLKRFVPQRPMPPVREEPRFPDLDDRENNHPASHEQVKAPIETDNPNPHSNPMPDHGGKDILSSDDELTGWIKLKKQLISAGKDEGNINLHANLTVRETAEIRGEV